MNQKKCRLILGDCLVEMAKLKAGSVDLVLCDLPYGKTDHKWDSRIDVLSLWEAYHRLCSKWIVLTATQPFTSALVMSNVKKFKYAWVWQKANQTNYGNASRQPLRCTEDVLVFGSGPYFPQMSEGVAYTRRSGPVKSADVYSSSSFKDHWITKSVGGRFPKNLIQFAKDKGNFHPTQKPVALMEYLIRTYTRPKDVVLDNCMGSGTTGIACANTDRNFIGIEQDASYFTLACARLQHHKKERAHGQA